MTTSTSTLVGPSPKQKPARLNPARRKAAKAKEAGRIPPSVNAALEFPINDLDCNSNPSKPVALQNGISRNAIARQVAVQNPALSNKQAQSKAVLCASSKVNKLHRSRDSPLNDPAFVAGGLIGCVAGAVILLGAGIATRVAGVDSAIHTARTSKVVVNNLIEDTVTSLKTGT